MGLRLQMRNQRSAKLSATSRSTAERAGQRDSGTRALSVIRAPSFELPPPPAAPITHTKCAGSLRGVELGPPGKATEYSIW